MNRKLSYEGKELHEMTQEELKNCCNLCYNHFDKLQVVEIVDTEIKCTYYFLLEVISYNM